MRRAPSRAFLEALRRPGGLLLAFDFDGTLAPIVARPGDARPRARTLSLLHRLSRLRPVAVITGRARADLALRLPGVRLAAAVGSHGLDDGAARPAPEVARWRRQLEVALAALPGVTLEDKRLSLAVHYRAAKDRRRAREAVRRALARLEPPPALLPGKLVVNVLPEGARQKGGALAALRRRFGARAALYVGDDVTDEDAFARPGVIGVRVGRSVRSRAAWYVTSQRAVDALLEVLLDSAPAAPRRRPPVR